jgi:hypothetical protein
MRVISYGTAHHLHPVDYRGNITVQLKPGLPGRHEKNFLKF